MIVLLCDDRFEHGIFLSSKHAIFMASSDQLLYCISSVVWATSVLAVKQLRPSLEVLSFILCKPPFIQTIKWEGL